MGNAYVPGLKVTPYTELHLERRLPLAGTVKVAVGEKVAWNSVVASTFLPGRVEMVNVAAKLALEPAEVLNYMLKKEGEHVEKGEALACSPGFFGFFKSTLEAPCSGEIESISEVSGQIVVRGAALPVELKAYVDGTVERLLDDEGVVVRCQGAFLQGIFGIGGETAGPLVMLTKRADEDLQPQDLRPEHRGAVVVGGSLVSGAFLNKAVEVGVAAVVAGGIDDSDLRAFLGYDLGVAITGSEDKGLSLIVTEGFGRIPMARRSFELLQSLQGRLASVSGATQIRAGVIRPEIIVPLSEPPAAGEVAAVASGLAVGAAVRLIREPHFGELAEVIALPSEPGLIPTGAKVRLAVIRLQNGEEMAVPRANLELIDG